MLKVSDQVVKLDLKVIQMYVILKVNFIRQKKFFEVDNIFVL